jgi:hypothetical protein
MKYTRDQLRPMLVRSQWNKNYNDLARACAERGLAFCFQEVGVFARYLREYFGGCDCIGMGCCKCSVRYEFGRSGYCHVKE